MMAALKRELGHTTIKPGVVTVPAEFTSAQQTVTTEAYNRAGVPITRVLHEPAAAAIAYGLHRAANVRYVLVYDMGGGTLDVSVMFAQAGAFTLIGSAGDGHLGGEDFDDCILRDMVRSLREGDGLDIRLEEEERGEGEAEEEAYSGSPSKKAQRMAAGGSSATAAVVKQGLCTPAWLKREAEKIKVKLNSASSSTSGSSEDVVVEWQCEKPSGMKLLSSGGGSSSADDKGSRVNSEKHSSSSSSIPPVYKHSMSRSSFEATCDPLFQRGINPVLSGLESANLMVDEVDEVVLVGGSSRLLRVRALLESLFKKPLRFTVDPDLAVAFGAAMIMG